MVTNKHIILLTGLPGSGKTTYMYEHYYNVTNEYANNPGLFELDQYINNGIYDLQKCLTNNISYFNCKNTFVIDGFLPLISDRINLIQELINAIQNRSYHGESIHITLSEIYWNENREFCIANDIYRHREILATNSINNTQYDPSLTQNDLTLLHLPKNITITLNPTEYKEVIKYSTDNIIDNFRIINKRNLDNKDSSDIIASKWVNSGKFIADFDVLDELLEILCPNITYLQYKKLYKLADISIEIDKEYEDYYSNKPTYYKRMVVHTDKLKTALKQLKLI